eukprot:scaffold3181_cov167-Amphora_coffeaeformis.AAC.6
MSRMCSVWRSQIRRHRDLVRTGGSAPCVLALSRSGGAFRPFRRFSLTFPPPTSTTDRRFSLTHFYFVDDELRYGTFAYRVYPPCLSSVESFVHIKFTPRHSRTDVATLLLPRGATETESRMERRVVRNLLSVQRSVVLSERRAIGLLEPSRLVDESSMHFFLRPR